MIFGWTTPLIEHFQWWCPWTRIQTDSRCSHMLAVTWDSLERGENTEWMVRSKSAKQHKAGGCPDVAEGKDQRVREGLDKSGLDYNKSLNFLLIQSLIIKGCFLSASCHCTVISNCNTYTHTRTLTCTSRLDIQVLQTQFDFHHLLIQTLYLVFSHWLLVFLFTHLCNIYRTAVKL